MKKIFLIAALGLFLASCGSSTYYHVGTGVKIDKNVGKNKLKVIAKGFGEAKSLSYI